MSEVAQYSLERIFDAPREMVWRAWTDPELLHRWYGPGVETIIHQFDLRPGGAWLNEMRWGESNQCDQRREILYRSVVLDQNRNQGYAQQ